MGKKAWLMFENRMVFLWLFGCFHWTALAGVRVDPGASDVTCAGCFIFSFQFLQFIERMCHVLSIDAITADVGLDMSFDTLLGRAEQLVKMEAEAIQDRKTHIHNLQRKLRSMKEQLESKDLHLDLMRKKVREAKEMFLQVVWRDATFKRHPKHCVLSQVTGLEEQLVGRSELEHEKDSEAMKSRKLVKLAEKYKRELEEANMEIRDLKAKLLEGSEFKVCEEESRQNRSFVP